MNALVSVSPKVLGTPVTSGTRFPPPAGASPVPAEPPPADASGNAAMIRGLVAHEAALMGYLVSSVLRNEPDM